MRRAPHGPAPTFGAAVEAGRAAVAGVAGASARLEAERLAAGAARISRARLLAELRAPMPPAAREAFAHAVARRAAGEPLAYVLGRAPFLDFEVAVGPAALIPRPETERLAEWAIERARRREVDGPGPARVLDVGTGSGVLALAVARACPGARVTATDLSPGAAAIAAANARALGVAGQVDVRVADLWPPCEHPFDVVVANLQYVGTGEMADVAPDVLAWEPHGALFAGRDGLALLWRLAAGVAERLAPGGSVGLEVGWRQADEVAARLAAALPTHDVASRPDDRGIARFVVAEPGDVR